MKLMPDSHFVTRIAALQQAIDHLPDETVRSAISELVMLKREVAAEILYVDPERSQAFSLRALRGRLDDVMVRFAEQYPSALTPSIREMLALGQPLAPGTIVSISRRLVEVARAWVAERIAGETAETIEVISILLRRAAIRGDTVFEVSEKIRGHLTGRGAFDSLDERAEVIASSELGLMQSIATQAEMVETQRSVPDLQKQWMYGHNPGKWACPGHKEADGQVRDVSANFRVRPAAGQPYEEIPYPRAAEASAANFVFCGCTSVPYREAWKSLGLPDLPRDTAEAPEFKWRKH